MTKEEIGQIIKESRISAELTQLQVAKRLERPQQTIASWESGKSQPDANTLFELFRVLGRSVDEAFGFQKNTPPLSGRAIKLAQNFDKLDEAGKVLLEDSLTREEKRMDTESALQKSLQAFINSFTILRIYKTPITDSTGIDLTEKPEPKMIQITRKTPEDQAATIRQVMIAKNAFGVRFRFDDGKEVIFAIDGDKVAGPGQPGIFTIDGKSFLKKIKNGMLYPIFLEKEPIPMPDELQCAGRVIGWFRNDSVEDIYGSNLQFREKRTAPGTCDTKGGYEDVIRIETPITSSILPDEGGKINYGNLHKARRLLPHPGLCGLHPGGQTGYEVQDLDADAGHDGAADREGAKPADGPLR